MIEFFVKRPVTTVVLVLFFVILGIASYGNLNIELTPKIEFPIVTITVAYPGATPLEIETQVINDIEEAVAELSEIKNIKSFAYENLGRIIVEFNLGTDADVKAMEAKDKVEAILNDLPENIEKPLIEKFDPLAVPVMDLILMSDTVDSRELYDYADKTLKLKLSAAKGVATVNIYGGKERQINVIIDPVLARARFIGINDVIDAIAMRNLNLPGGVIEKTEDAMTVRFVGEFATLDEMRNMELVSHEDSVVKLGDIAKVEDGYKEVKSIARYNRKDAVGLSIIKSNDGNTVEIAAEVEKMLPGLRKTLPQGMELVIATNNASYIVRENDDALLNIVEGILLTVIILYLFTGDIRTTFVSTLVIPASVISSFFLMDHSDFTINMLTLSAMSMALGTLIANAIVVIECILEHLDKGKEPQEAAIDGTKEVADAVIASVGTNLVVFTPIAFIGGIVGPFLKQFGMTVIYATIFSLIASFTLTPMLCAKILKKRESGSNNKPAKKRKLVAMAHQFMDYLLLRYRVIYDVVFRHPVLTMAATALFLVGSLMLVPFLGSEFMPQSDQDKINVRINAPQGSTIERTLDVVRKVEDLFEPLPEVVGILANIGEDGEENATITVDLLPSGKRDRSDMDIINEILPAISKIAGADIDLERAGIIAKGNEGDVTLNIHGADYDRMIELSSLAMKKMSESGYFRSLTSSYKPPKKEIRFIPNEEAMMTQGIQYADLARAMRTSIYGDDSNVFKERGEEYDINVELDEYYKKTFDDISQINIITRKGLLPITSLGKVAVEKSQPAIWHRDKERIIQVAGYLSKGTAGEVTASLDKMFAKMPFAEGEGYRWVGDSEYQEESNQELGKAFILACILTFMVLAGLMNSSLHPITIGSSMVTSFVGVFLLMFLMGTSMNMTAMLAMVMLVGLVVNNSILLIDAVLKEEKQHLSIKDALWMGTEEKFRAILMTSLAIIFGVVPMLTSTAEHKVAMAVVLTGGMLASIVFTFILTPVIFLYMENLKKCISRRL